MAQPRIHHWRHGWIPLDEVARAEKYGPHRRADMVASALLARKSKVEPAVTADLKGLAHETGGSLVGLSFRLKSRESLARKLATKAEQRGTTPEAEATRVGDVLRYTMTFPHQRYTAGVQHTAATLRARGYRVELENNWPKGTVYKGVNGAVVSPSGEEFELQFHTPESYALKEAQHGDYETVRDPGHSAAARRAAHARMVSNWNNITVPAAVHTVPAVVEPKPVTF